MYKLEDKLHHFMAQVWKSTDLRRVFMSFKVEGLRLQDSSGIQAAYSCQPSFAFKEPQPPATQWDRQE